MKPSKENFEEWNEQNAIKYDLDKFYDHPNRLFRSVESKRVDAVLEFASIENGNRVLDLGCGTGHILRKIVSGTLTGIDASETQISRAKYKLSADIELIKARAENIPFEDEYFDRIICSEVLEHVLEPETVLKEMNRVLKDDGIISLSIPNEKLIILTKNVLLKLGMKGILQPKGSGWDLAARNNLEEWHIHEYSLKLIKQQISEFFEIEKFRKIPLSFFPYRYVMKLKKSHRKIYN